MHPLRVSVALLLLAALVVIVAAPGCSSSKSTTPTMPGGGGGSVTFSFTFPVVGSSSSRVFTDVGSFDYHCMAHQGGGMTGTVTVSAGSVVDSALVQVGSGSSNIFNPATVTIKPGGLVRWVRPSGVGASNHTATR